MHCVLPRWGALRNHFFFTLVRQKIEIVDRFSIKFGRECSNDDRSMVVLGGKLVPVILTEGWGGLHSDSMQWRVSMVGLYWNSDQVK